MPCPDCSSPNTQRLAHYWESLPAESPLKDRYAPPPIARARTLAILGIIGAGIWVLTTGAVLWGLAIAIGGLLWGALTMASVTASQAAYGQWETQQLCLSCTHRFQP
ncbi:hypothetical protein [Streptomyces chiangmaiensis]|uniref:hypothetical protein n=1 Tax=Streptomyces chiangmaiensis TaxID=766497 RepID=UPI0031EA5DA5